MWKGLFLLVSLEYFMIQKGFFIILECTCWNVQNDHIKNLNNERISIILVILLQLFLIDILKIHYYSFIVMLTRLVVS